jgi:hypothetical protein
VVPRVVSAPEPEVLLAAQVAWGVVIILLLVVELVELELVLELVLVLQAVM